MSNNDNWTPEWSDVKIALGLLSRIPVGNQSEKLKSRGPNQLWAFPVVGVLLGILACCIAELGIFLNLNNLAIGFLIVASTAITTGAMHFDGLADTLDGIWGGWSISQRLAIMKDSHIGVYGVVGLIVSVGLQAALYGQIIKESVWPIIGIMAISRAVMVPMLAFLKNPRSEGLSSDVGQPKLQTVFLAMTLGIIASISSGAWIALGGAILAACTVGAIARNKIGGQTGDILGATQQTAEVFALICVATFI